MSDEKVSVTLVTLDRTRRASIRVPRTMYISDVIKASTRRWFLSFGMDYQVCNTTTGRILLPSDSLNVFNVRDGDILMLQPFAAHGGACTEKKARSMRPAHGSGDGSAR